MTLLTQIVFVVLQLSQLITFWGGPFLLDCPAFNHRKKLLDDINPFIAKLNANPVGPNFVNILLYGNDSLTIRENKAILESTLAFISNSGRFPA